MKFYNFHIYIESRIKDIEELSGLKNLFFSGNGAGYYQLYQKTDNGGKRGITIGVKTKQQFEDLLDSIESFLRIMGSCAQK